MKRSIIRQLWLSVMIVVFGIQGAMAELRPFEKKGKFGYENEAGYTVIKPQFTVAFPYENGMAKVQKDGNWGYIDEAGKYIIKPEYTVIEEFNPQGVALVQKGKKYGYVRRDGSFLIKPEYDFIGRYNNSGYCWVAKGNTLEMSQKGLFKGDELIVKPKYQYLGFYTVTDSIDYTDGHILWGTNANEIRSNLSMLSEPAIEYIWAMKTPLSRTILDMSGRELFSPSNYSLGAPKDNMVLIGYAGKKKTQYNYYDLSGSKATKLFKKDTSKDNESDAKINAFQPFSRQRAAIQEGNSFYIIDTSGRKVSPPYTLLKPLGNVGYIMVKNAKCGLLNMAGEEIVDAKYLDIWAPGDDENILGAKDPETQLCGFIDATGAIVVPFQYQSANNFKYGRGCVKTDDGWGMVDKNNRQVIKCIYNDIMLPAHADTEHIWVKHREDDKWRCRKLTDDSQAFESSFDGVRPFNAKNLAYVMVSEGAGDEKKSHFGLIDTAGNLIIPTSFNDCSRVDKALEHIKEQGKSKMLLIDAHRFNLYLDPQSNSVKLSDPIDETKWDY